MIMLRQFGHTVLLGRLVCLFICLLASTALAADDDSALRGTVLDEKGEPAASVAVLLVEPGDRPSLYNGRLNALYGAELASTDDSGRFYFPRAPEGSYRLIALGDNGYGESEVGRPGEAVPKVALEPWATIEGVARVGGEPVAGAPIRGSFSESIAESYGIVASAKHWIDLNAGPDGRFKIDRLKPGRWSVSQGIRSRPGGAARSSHAQPVDVVSGKTAQVTLGGSGRPVIGRIEMADSDTAPGIRMAAIQNDWLSPDVKPPATVGEIEAMSQADREALAATDAFQEYERRFRQAFAERRSYIITLQPDGSFRAEDVPPGEYQLWISLGQMTPDGATLELVRNIVVPPAESEGTDPLDLGTLPLRPVVSLAIGDEVPDFAFRTVDGVEHSLSDFRGKYVLLDAWATWCGPCIGETPNILAVQEAFKGDDRLATVGLSMDDEPEAARRYAEMKGLTWTNGFIGQWDATTVDDKIGIGGIPDIRLIGPDGKLVAKVLRGEEILEAVKQALEKAESAPPE
jgi:thiol-disulfide isomerase/thioredoxin